VRSAAEISENGKECKHRKKTVEPLPLTNLSESLLIYNLNCHPRWTSCILYKTKRCHEIYFLALCRPAWWGDSHN